MLSAEVDSHFCDKAPRFFDPTASRCATNPLAGVPWHSFELLFIFGFIIELGARYYYHREKFLKNYPRFFEDWINCLDVFLILVALADLTTTKSIRITLLFRVVRIARVANLLRLLRFFKPLFLFVVGSWDVVKTLFWIFPVLFLLIYIFAIFTTEIVGVDDRVVPVFADPDTTFKSRRIGHTSAFWPTCSRMHGKHRQLRIILVAYRLDCFQPGASSERHACAGSRGTITSAIFRRACLRYSRRETRDVFVQAMGAADRWIQSSGFLWDRIEFTGSLAVLR